MPPAAHTRTRSVLSFFRFILTSPRRAVHTNVGPDLPPPHANTGGGHTSELHCSDADFKELKIIIQRARTNYEPHVGARVPPPLASLLLACLAVDPQARPDATGARIAAAALAAQACTWGGGGTWRLPHLAGTPTDTSGSVSGGARPAGRAAGRVRVG